MDHHTENNHVIDSTKSGTDDNYGENEALATNQYGVSDTFGQALLSWISSPLDYVTRTSRKSFWLVQLFLLAINTIALIPLVYYSTIPSPGPNFDKIMLASWGLFFLVNIVLFFFNLPLAVRRIRDAGVSPYAACALLIPFIGWIVVLVICAFPSKFANDQDADIVVTQDSM